MSFDRREPFTTAQAVRAGINRSALHGHAFRRIFRGVHVDARVALTPLLRARAALIVHPPSAFASHTTAARLFGAPVPTRCQEVDVSVFAPGDRRRRDGIRSHVAKPGAAVVTVRGVRCSAAEQTFVQLGTMLGLVELVVVGDHLVRHGFTTPERLVAAAAASTDDGCVLARRAAGYVRRHVDSPMETRLRMLIVLAGLPEPVVNFIVYHRNGRVRYRFDLCYPALKLIVEYDGRQHRDDLDQWDHDNDRDDWLDSNDWRIVKVFSRGIYKEPATTIARVYTALRERGCPGLPRRLSDAWRPYFPTDRPAEPAI